MTSTVRLVRPLAEGGMGRVWVAEHLGLRAEVVVKLMAPEVAERPDGAARFAREAAIAAAIKSPHVVQVFDHGVIATGPDSGTPYIVMELLEGKDLGAYLAERGRMAPLDVVTLVEQVGKALSKAHKASIVHRDIKPENIFLCETDGGELFVKLLDFGAARCDEATSSRTTVPGQIMGTPYYMSPEQSIGAVDIDERSDIWSLGVVTFEALTGVKPFDGPSVGAITIAIHGPLPRMTDFVTDLPPALDDWFARACAQLPEDRFSSVREATRALVEAVTGAPPLEPSFESTCFPPVEARGNSMSARPVTRPIQPLIDTLPKAGSERRFTTIAAGIVMTATAVAMLAIVLGRTTPDSEVVHSPEPVAAAPVSSSSSPLEPATPPSVPEPAEPEKQESEQAPTVAKASTPTTTVRTSRSSVTAREERVKSSKRQVRSSRRGGDEAARKDNIDDDLVRLSNAASQHLAPESARPGPTESAPSEAPVAPPSGASPAVVPPLPPPAAPPPPTEESVAPL